MAISAPGVGSGLDVNSIVTQLTAIEKQPLKALQTKATAFQTQLSLYSKVKSQASALGDAAAVLGGIGGWSTQKATSANPAAVGVTVGSSAIAASLAVKTTQLARAQSTASMGVASGVAVAATGTLSIQLGNWASGSFSASTQPALSVTIDAADTVSMIASKINAASAGVTATVLRDGTNERLVVSSKISGEENGFRIDASGNANLSMFGFTDAALTTPSSAGMYRSQTAQNALVEINGVSVVSATNKMVDVIPGVTLQLSQVTTEPVEVVSENDLEVVQKNIQTFIDAYNTLNQTLADATKYDATSKKGGPLQGDSTTVGLQNALRSIFGSSSMGSTYARLSDIGIERQTDGSLKLNTTKLTGAIQHLDEVKKLFTTNNNNPTTNGFGLKVRDFARGVVASDGAITNKSAAIQGAIDRNSKDQDRVNDRASRVEAQLLKTYSALDAKMAQMSSLSSYVTAQLAQWNKSTN